MLSVKSKGLPYQDNQQTQRTKKVVDVLTSVCNLYFLKSIDYGTLCCEFSYVVSIYFFSSSSKGILKKILILLLIILILYSPIVSSTYTVFTYEG